MAVAQGVNTQLKRVVQSALGTPGSSGSQLLRRVTIELNKESDTYSSNEIASHQQSTGATQGPARVNGSLNGELSAGVYDKEFAVLLRRDFTTPFSAIASVALTIAGSGPTYTVTRGSGSFLTDGVKKGMVVRLSVGSLNAANIAKNLLVLGVTATVLTVAPLNGVALVAEGPISGCTVSAPGKSTYVPNTGHTNKYITYEKWFADISRSELFSDVKPASADIAIPATGIATTNFALAGLVRTLGSAEVCTSPTAESTANQLTAVLGKLVVNGSITSVTNIQVQINGATTTGEPEIGSATLSDLQRGRVAVSGSFAAKFTGATLQTLRDNQTVITLIVALADSGLDGAEFVALSLPAIKLFSDNADDGEKEIIRTYNFTAQYYGAGGAAVADNATIVQIHDSLAA